MTRLATGEYPATTPRGSITGMRRKMDEWLKKWEKGRKARPLTRRQKKAQGE